MARIRFFLPLFFLLSCSFFLESDSSKQYKFQLGRYPMIPQNNKVVLYMRDTCPYCQKVLKVLEKHNKQITIKDISEEKNRKELLSVGGKQQVPCIVIDGTPMYESNDIIAWINKHYEML